MNNTMKIVLLVAAGVVVGASGVLLLGGAGEDTAGADSGERKPLYWVAPMDPNYRRDKPGKSPMGMDLIPVYEEGSGDDSPGTVRVSPDVVNNLGVRTAEAEMGPFNTHVNTVGYVQYDEDQLTNIHPRVEGWIETLYVKAEGDPVKKGQPLYTLYSPTLVNAQEELVLALNRNNPRLIRAAMERLAALKVSERVINKLKKTRKVQRTITMYAPQSGVVDNLGVREGNYIKPGTLVMSIGVLDDIWVVGEIFESQLPLVREGDPVTMTLDYLPGRKWQGVVEYLYPNVSPKTRTARVRMRFANPDHALRPGMFARLAIHGRDGDETLLIPKEALIRTGNSSRVVLALGDGKFKSINVAVGRIGSEQVEILSGLEKSERVVTSAQFLIDSESSKTSDFKRMDHGSDTGTRPQSVWVAARVESLMPEHHMATLHHEPINDWDWPAMTMDFTLDKSIDMSALEAGMELHIQISEADDGSYRVQQVHIPDGADKSMNMPEMDHSQHQDMSQEAMPEMDHSQHQDMNQEAMSEMDHSQHQDMNQEAMPEMDHSQHQGMVHDSSQQELSND